MDFSPDEAQRAVTRAAAGVLERADAPALDEPWDWPLWQKLGQAGLLSLTVPDWLGGDGQGVLEAAALLTEVGRHAAPVPALATLMTGVLPVVRWGSREVQAAVLAGVAAGDTRAHGGDPRAVRAPAAVAADHGHRAQLFGIMGIRE